MTFRKLIKIRRHHFNDKLQKADPHCFSLVIIQIFTFIHLNVFVNERTPLAIHEAPK